MGYQVIVQPDGKLAVFSANSGRLEAWDATPEELAGWFAEAAALKARAEAEQVIARVVAGDSPYCRREVTWDEALQSDEEACGEAWAELGPAPAAIVETPPL